MEERIAELTEEQAEYALTLRGDLFWSYLEEVTRADNEVS